jgi:hypothetical protein
MQGQYVYATVRATSLGFAMLLAPSVALIACGGGNSGGASGNKAITASISANPTIVDLGQTVNLSWSSRNATSCLATSAPTESDWTAIVATSGSATVTPASYAGQVYSLTCVGSGSSSATASTSVSVNSAAVGIVNPNTYNSASGSYTPTEVWAGQSCSFDGYDIINITILPTSANSTGGPIGVLPSFAGTSSQYGGMWGGWSATGDGTGILVDYAPNGNSCYRFPKPASILNIDGSTASGSFSGELVDQGGATTHCSFTLVPAGGYSTIGC